MAKAAARPPSGVHRGTTGARARASIRGRVEVDRLLISRRATGVVCVDGTLHHAEKVILSAGTYGIAAILIRAGIGPADDRVRASVADTKWDTAPRSASWRGLTTAPDLDWWAVVERR